MATLSRLSLSEKRIAAQADLTGLSLAYELVADGIPRDTSADLASTWVFADSFDFEGAGGAMPAPIERNPEEDLPLDAWLDGQAAWYDQHEGDGMDLVALAIRRIADGARFYRCATVAELVSQSDLFRRAFRETVATPDCRPNSLLAGIIDAEVEGYLLLKTDVGRLVAWTLLGLANDADYYCADTSMQFVETKAVLEGYAEEESRRRQNEEG